MIRLILRLLRGWRRPPPAPALIPMDARRSLLARVAATNVAATTLPPLTRRRGR